MTPKASSVNWQRVIGYVVIAGGLATTTLGGLKAYDGWNRKVLEANPEWDCQAYTYDIRGNVLSTLAYPKASCVSSNGRAALIASPPTPMGGRVIRKTALASM